MTLTEEITLADARGKRVGWRGWAALAVLMLPVLLVFMVKIAGDKHVMGKNANSRVWTGLTWFTVIAVIILTVVMFVLQATGV